MTICRQCAAEWTSLKFEHCTVCHQTFAGTRPGDAHRVGQYDAEPPSQLVRRCLEPTEMLDVGMWVSPALSGLPVWRGRRSRTGEQHRRTDPSASLTEPHSA